MTAYFRFVLRNRFAVLAGCGLITLLALASISRGRMGSSLVKLFLGESPGFQAWVDGIHLFGSDEILVIGLEDPDLLTPDHLERLQTVVDRIVALPMVDRVLRRRPGPGGGRAHPADHRYRLHEAARPIQSGRWGGCGSAVAPGAAAPRRRETNDRRQFCLPRSPAKLFDLVIG